MAQLEHIWWNCNRAMTTQTVEPKLCDLLSYISIEPTTTTWAEVPRLPPEAMQAAQAGRFGHVYCARSRLENEMPGNFVRLEFPLKRESPTIVLTLLPWKTSILMP